ncbi:outer membrane protein TolC [Elusimicrobium simillimum]|uniref:TolC family protein n=1 Tax=Elusimicrobium simillimum TaxID=3143438 RepID=UPI003C6EE7CD
MRKCVLLLLMALTPLLNAKDYSFEAAFARALTVDEQVLSAAKEVEKYQAERNAAYGLYMPKIGVKGSYTFINDPIVIDLNDVRSTIQPIYDYLGIGVTLPDFSMQVQDDRFFKANAFASLPLFTGGKIRAANLAAVSSLEESLARYEGIKNNLLVDVSQKYFGALLAREVVKVRKEFLGSAKEHAGNSAKMFKAGTISKVEKMSADITLSQAQRDYDSAVNDASLAETLLKNLLSEGEEIQFTSGMFVCEDVEPLDYFQVSARQSNSSLKVLDAKVKMTDANVKAQTSPFMPTVYLFGSRELYENDLTLLDPDYSYGVGFEWNLFEGGSSYNKSKAARRQRESVVLLKEKQVKDINTAVEYYYKKMQNAVYKYTSVQSEVLFAQEFLRAREVSFRAGVGTSLEVNMARSQKLKSDVDNLNAQYEFVVSLATILNLTGDVKSFDRYKANAQRNNK